MYNCIGQKRKIQDQTPTKQSCLSQNNDIKQKID